ncbi:MAG: 2-oxoglutarate dehydrogenase E1 component, partial [Bacteroidales bacterium]|nr:2-oxoglutarate dehydrogenase E1 component [Bacteroidales bacterium]
MDNYTFLNSSDPSVIEGLYQQFKANPDSVDAEWRKFFAGFDFAVKSYAPSPKASVKTSSEFKVLALIDEYRKRGHLFTETNPVRKRRQYFPTLDIENFGLTKQDLDTVFEAGKEIGLGAVSLSKIIEALHQTYCRSFGAEFMYIRNLEIVQWMLNRMESSRNMPSHTVADKKYILQKLDRAVSFEKFIHK